MMLPSEILSKAADLIEPKGKWTQGWFAKNADGGSLKVFSQSATCFCAVGAMRRVAGSRGELATAFATFISASKIPEPERNAGANIVQWNDDPARTQSEVVEAFRKAASLAAEKERAQ